jgi:hypothetical protein
VSVEVGHSGSCVVLVVTMHRYTANVLRRDPEAQPRFVLDFLLMHCAELFKAEGLEVLSLGPAYLYGPDGLSGVPGESRVLRLQFLALQRRSTKYRFRALGEHKDRYKVSDGCVGWGAWGPMCELCSGWAGDESGAYLLHHSRRPGPCHRLFARPGRHEHLASRPDLLW